MSNIITYRCTTEDWCPNHFNDTVQIEFIDNTYNPSTDLHRVIVKGNDDIAMYIDSGHALEIFYEIKDYEKPITFSYLKNIGFHWF